MDSKEQEIKQQEPQKIYKTIRDSLLFISSNRSFLNNNASVYFSNLNTNDINLFENISNTIKHLNINDSNETKGIISTEIYNMIFYLYFKLGRFKEKQFEEFLEFIRSLELESKIYPDKNSIKTNYFVDFLIIFYENSSSQLSPYKNFQKLLGDGIKINIIRPIALKYFRIIFFKINLNYTNFYEFSLISNLERLYFKNNDYLKIVLKNIGKCFIELTNESYYCNSKIKIDVEFIDYFSTIIEPLINSFNGFINELQLEMSLINKIFYCLIVFYTQKSQSMFLEDYGIYELIYCVLRSFKGGDEYAQKLEKFIRTRLSWNFEVDKINVRLDSVYQTIFKHEFNKIVGDINDVMPVNIKYGLNNKNGIDKLSKEGLIMAKVVQKTPRLNEHRSVKAFSPLSQRIAHARGVRDSPDSKRRLDFK